MTDPMMDQARTASRITKERLASSLGLEPEELGSREAFKGSLFDRLFDVVKTNPRCMHLVERPIQPSYFAMHVGIWGCAECLEPFLRAVAGKLGRIEEFTCDLCRKYSPASIRPFTVASGMWVIIGSACSRCGDQEGFHMVERG